MSEAHSLERQAAPGLQPEQEREGDERRARARSRSQRPLRRLRRAWRGMRLRRFVVTGLVMIFAVALAVFVSLHMASGPSGTPDVSGLGP